MKKFTTNMIELLSRIAEACDTADDDLLLESYETLDFYHPKAMPRTEHLRRIVTVSLSRRQHCLADSALALMTTVEMANERESQRVLLLRAMNMSRNLLRKMEATAILTALIRTLGATSHVPESLADRSGGSLSIDSTVAVATKALSTIATAPDRDFSDDLILSAPDPFNIPDITGTAKRELQRILKLIAFREPSGNPPGDLQSVLLTSIETFDPGEVSRALSVATSVPVYEFTRRLCARTGVALAHVQGTQNARTVCTVLADRGIPSFHTSDEWLRQLVPVLTKCNRIEISEQGVTLLLSSSCHPVNILWEDLGVIECVKIHATEQQRVTKTGIARVGSVMSSPGWIGVGLGATGAAALAAYKSGQPETVSRDIVKHVMAIYSEKAELACYFDLDEGAIIRPYSFLATVVKPKEEWLAEALLLRATKALAGPGLHRLAAQGRTGRWHDLTLASADDIRHRMVWLTALKKLELL